MLILESLEDKAVIVDALNKCKYELDCNLDTLLKLHSIGIEITGVPFCDKLAGITLKKLLSECERLIKGEYSEGYSSKKEQIRDRLIRTFKREFSSKYPDILIECSLVSGLGYYSSYSDFILTLNGINLIGVGSHESTIKRHAYKAEIYLDLTDIDEFYSIDIIDCDAYYAAGYISQYYESRRALQKYNELKEKLQNTMQELDSM